MKLEFGATSAINDTKSAEILGIPASSNFSGQLSAITHGQDNYTHLNQAGGINIVTLDGQTYALVAGRFSDGVQIIKLFDSDLLTSID